MSQWEILAYVACFSILFQGGITPEWKTQVQALWDLVVAAWAVGFVNLVYLGGAMNYLGIHPGRNLGLLGILLSVFLHRDWEHLICNTLPFIILGWLVILQDPHHFYLITGVIMLTEGIGIWLCGQSYTIHIGASGIIFGYLGFLLLHGYFDSNLVSIILSITVGLRYGRILKGILPGQTGISWEGHLFGFLGGILAARWF